MRKISVMIAVIVSLVVYGETISLPKVKTKGGMPLIEALAKRSSSREFKAGAELSQQELANLLWCANGFNRDEKRTAPSAVNAQAIDIYVFDAKGIWLYNAKENSLEKAADGDFREATGMQPFVKNAAVNLVYVYDKSRWPMKGECDGRWAAADAAFCAENVYLYCASTGLKVVVRGSFKEEEVRKLLKLRESQVIALAQSVGK